MKKVIVLRNMENVAYIYLGEIYLIDSVITCLVLLQSKDSFSYYKTVDCARILDIQRELDNLLPGKDTKAFLI